MVCSIPGVNLRRNVTPEFTINSKVCFKVIASESQVEELLKNQREWRVVVCAGVHVGITLRRGKTELSLS